MEVVALRLKRVILALSPRDPGLGGRPPPPFGGPLNDERSRQHPGTCDPAAPRERSRSMLVLSRRVREKIVLPDLSASVEILGVKGNTVRLGIQAPPEIRVLRGELPDRKAEW